MQNIPVFIINLKKDHIKRDHMVRLCREYAIEPQFMDAIDGISLEPNELESIYRKDDSSRQIGKELSLAEIGCALSHRAVFLKMIEENINASIILEDDVDFCDNFPSFIKLIGLLPQNCELLLLGHHSARSRSITTRYNFWYKFVISKNFVLRRPCELACGTYGYYITKMGAKKLISCMKTISLPADHYTGLDYHVNLYILEQPVVFINQKLDHLSNIARGRKDMRDKVKRSKKNYKRKIAQFLGIYSFLDFVVIQTNLFIHQINLLRKYK